MNAHQALEVLVVHGNFRLPKFYAAPKHPSLFNREVYEMCLLP